MIDFDIKWADLDFDNQRWDARDIIEDELPYSFVELGEKGNHSGVEVGNTEYLNFALEQDDIPHEYRDDDEGWLTSEGEARVLKFFQDLLAGNRYWGAGSPFLETLDISSQMGGDDPNYTLSFIIQFDQEGTVGDVFENIIDPFFAAIRNATDPGTFNHPYVFSHMDD